ncbi:hypothetical protein ASF65_02705 [Aureimonas sp. Leaf324]|jgi:hypothetical protein|nr:hypothetical protein ASF65_02705 [Aureimonas sp. Leaf324]
MSASRGFVFPSEIYELPDQRRAPFEEASDAVTGRMVLYLASDAGCREIGDRCALEAKFDRV